MTQAQDIWYRQRTTLLVLGMVHYALCKIEVTAVSVLLLRYYKDVLEVENPKVYYGIAMSAFFVSALISVKVSAWYMDKTHNIRRIASIALGFETIGNLVYSIPLSKWLPILGRLMCGLNDGMKISIIAELSRVYDKKSLAKHLTIFEAIGMLSFIFGPILPLMFSGVDFYIGSFRVNMYNAFTILHGGFFGLFWLACHYLLPNLTLDPTYETLKFEIFKEQPNKKTNTKKKLLTTRNVVTSFHMLLLCSVEGVLSYNYYQTELLVNMIATYNFHWSMITIAELLGVSSLISFFLLIIIRKYSLHSSLNIYYLYVVCFVLIAASQSMMNLVIAMEINGTVLQLVLFGFAVVCHLFQGAGSNAYVRWMLFALSPANSATIVESNRYMFAKSSSFVGFFVSGFVYPNLQYTFPVYNLVYYIVISLLLFNQDQILQKCESKKMT